MLGPVGARRMEFGCYFCTALFVEIKYIYIYIYIYIKLGMPNTVFLISQIRICKLCNDLNEAVQHNMQKIKECL